MISADVASAMRTALSVCNRSQRSRSRVQSPGIASGSVQVLVRRLIGSMKAFQIPVLPAMSAAAQSAKAARLRSRRVRIASATADEKAVGSRIPPALPQFL